MHALLSARDVCEHIQVYLDPEMQTKTAQLIIDLALRKVPSTDRCIRPFLQLLFVTYSNDAHDAMIGACDLRAMPHSTVLANSSRAMEIIVLSCY